MNLYFRMLWLLLTSRFRPPVNVPDTVSLDFRVLPNDLDTNMHMNNGRYATIMDLGRLNLMQRVGLIPHLVSKRWFPVIADLQLQFLRPLKLLQKYSLQTRLAAWDEKWFYLEQTFHANGKDVARGLVRAQIRRGREAVPVAEILQIMEYREASPEPVEHYKNRNGYE